MQNVPRMSAPSRLMLVVALALAAAGCDNFIKLDKKTGRQLASATKATQKTAKQAAKDIEKLAKNAVKEADKPVEEADTLETLAALLPS